jgi:diaminopropionate ammonia-lyase
LAEPASTETFLANPVVPSPPGRVGRTQGPSPRAFHRRLPGYSPTPLLRLPSVARDLGLAELVVKDESERLGLPSFKMLGASWAAYRALCERLGAEPEWDDIQQLPRAFEPLHPLTLITATDGNHGRALARFATFAGVDAHVLVPAGTAEARIEAIRSEGATVELVRGSYEDAVERAAEADQGTHLVVSDTSWEGYERIPAWVIEGYDTIFLEIEQQLDDKEMATPDVVVVPIGVGALGAAAAAFAERIWHDGRPALLGVEPTSAACVLVSVARGEITEVPGPHTSIMAGLNCGLPSRLAFPRVRDRFAAFVAISDPRAAAALITLAGEGIVAGETGAAALGGLVAALDLDAGGVLGLGSGSSVLLLLTEGATDPVSYERIVGTPPERVRASASREG